jgi:hypothetical protein
MDAKFVFLNYYVLRLLFVFVLGLVVVSRCSWLLYKMIIFFSPKMCAVGL